MNHQKLHCYQRLLRLICSVQTLMPTWPPGLAFMGDQIRRAGASAALNLVEGNGRVTPKDRRVFFVRAAASLAEVDAALDIGVIYVPQIVAEVPALRRELTEIYAMIRALR